MNDTPQENETKNVKTPGGRGVFFLPILAIVFLVCGYYLGQRQQEIQTAPVSAKEQGTPTSSPEGVPIKKGLASSVAENSDMPEGREPYIEVEKLGSLKHLDRGHENFLNTLRQNTKVSLGLSPAQLKDQAIDYAQHGQIYAALEKAIEVFLQGDDSLLLEIAKWELARSNRQNSMRFAWETIKKDADPKRKAEAYAILSENFSAYDEKKLAIAALHKSLELAENAENQHKMDVLEGRALVIQQTRILSEQDIPQFCIDFSQPLVSAGQVDYDNYVQVEPQVKFASILDGNSLCLEGFQHGSTFDITLRKGLPGAENGKLLDDYQEKIDIRDRKPRLSFASKSYILPRLNNAGIPIRSVNASRATLRLLRVNDRNLISQAAPRLSENVWPWGLETISDQTGEEVWTGEIDLRVQKNKETVTALPLSTVLPKTVPGIYLLSAKLPEELSKDYAVSQWVVMTDIGLLSSMGEDGISIFARSYASAQPAQNLNVRLYSRNNTELASMTTNAEGIALFPPGLRRATGGNTPAMVMAFGKEGEFSFLDLSKPAFDLSDRGVAGRETSKALDAFLYGDRDIYRPGETVELVTLLRDEKANALKDVPNLTLKVFRPDGVQFTEFVLPSEQAQGSAYHLPIAIPSTARIGNWSIQAYIDPKAPAVGALSFLVEDFVPARLSLRLEPSVALLSADKESVMKAQADYLYGAPGSKLNVKTELRLVRADNPFAEFSDYRFGRVDENFTELESAFDDSETDEKGVATLPIKLPVYRQGSLPLEAQVRATVFEPGGRGTSRTAKLPVAFDGLAIGIDPLFDYAVEEGTDARFHLVAVDAAGKMQETEVRYRLVREEYSYQWYSSGDSWNYRQLTRDVALKTGVLQQQGTEPLTLTLPIGEYGVYRLDTFVPGKFASTASASYRFSVGWSSDNSEDRPDKLSVRAAKEKFPVGTNAEIIVEAPFAGEAEILVARDRILSRKQQSLVKGENRLSVPVTSDIGVGAYVLVTALRPAEGKNGQGPARALGLTWLSVDPSPQTLSVSIESPERVEPEQEVNIPVAVSGASSEQVHLTLAAVDEGILQLTDFQTPKSLDYYFAKRRLALELRDAYGKLIDTKHDAVGTLRSGGDGAGRHAAGLPDKWIKPLALFSGVVSLDEHGRTEIPLKLPAFQGKVRLMVIAWSDTKLGQAESEMIVRSPVILHTSLPRFLSDGDRSDIAVSVRNIENEQGSFTLSYSVEGAAEVLEPKEATQTLTVAKGAEKIFPLALHGKGLGRAVLTLRLTDASGREYGNFLPFTVRPKAPLQAKLGFEALQSGQAVSFDSSTAEGFASEGGKLMVSASTVPDFGLPGLLAQLSRYPYGCLEQTMSRAFPLLFVNELEDLAKLKKESADAAIVGVIEKLGELQADSGAFGLWTSMDPAEPWLTTYAIDFLLRAEEKGHAVPEFLKNKALDWVRGRVIQGDFESDDLSFFSYGFYLLSKTHKIDPAAVRYFYDEWFSRLDSVLARTQIAAALAIIGDEERSKRAFQSVFESVPGVDESSASRYGSALSDRAALLTFAVEGKLDPKLTMPLAQNIAKMMQATPSLTTQEQAWIAAAASLLHAQAQPLDIALNEQEIRGITTFRQEFTFADLKEKKEFKNLSTSPVYFSWQVDGYPSASLPAYAKNFSIKKTIFDRTGKKVELNSLRQNETYVVLIEGAAHATYTHDAMVVDLLPAGLEIENAHLANSTTLSEMTWLPDLTRTSLSEARDDRFLAAIRFDGASEFAVAYIVRAVTPGQYVLPGVMIENMYELDSYARAEEGNITLIK